jgi:hypothetical protein
MSENKRESYSIIGGDGSLETYNDPFANVTKEDAEQAEVVEGKIIQAKAVIELGFFALAEMITEFDTKKFYKARGFERFKDWVESPEIEISFRVAQDLMRIQREVVPMLAQHSNEANIQELITQAGVSKVRALLPLLADPATHDDFKELIIDAPDVTWRDLRNEVKKRRGVESNIADAQLVMFLSEIKLEQGDFYTVQVSGTDGNNIDILGTLKIRKKWWPRWENRISEKTG